MNQIKFLLVLLFSCGLLHEAYSQSSVNAELALTKVTIIDVENDQQWDNMTLVIQDDRIKSIGSSDSIMIDETTRVIDLTGNYVIPGLIDSHVHLFRPHNRKEILSQLLNSGITTVRDMGGDVRMMKTLNQEIQDGTFKGPDIYYSATFFGPTFLKDPRTKFAARGYEPGTAPWMRVITKDSDLESFIIDAKELGVSGLKIYSNVAPELLNELTALAHDQGVKVWSHSSIFPSKPSDAVAANVDVLSHCVGMIFESATEMPQSFNEAIREYVPRQDFRNTDPIAPVFSTLLEKMKRKDIIFEPTLSAWNKKLRQKAKSTASNTQQTNPTKHLTKAAGKLDVEAINIWSNKITRTAYQKGVKIAAGTDLNTEIKWVQDEMILLTESGMSTMDVIKAATLNNAEAIGIEDDHGSIAEGKKANLLVLSENPLTDIQNIRKVTTVFKNGIEVKD